MSEIKRVTKLLARLKNSIRLIDRPHGQHSVILAEDASKYMENQSERNDPGPIVSGSRQIYLTFPAESTFTEEDVANYFKKYAEKLDLPMTCGSHYTDMDSDLHSRWESSRLLGKLFMEEQEQDIEVQTRRFSELQLAQKPTSNQSYFGYSVDELKASEAIACAYHSKFPSAERFNYPLDVLNSSSASDDINPKHSGTNHTDSERYE
ncbi:Zinc finger CCCH domain-containing protein 18 [Camellia lanceoleosa]|uniref:Zinc finger CCCH domain-containing protein 18 n=1 Tax=Camellia lanceoleosa TaxID=1840588 RepID=A0ACC0F8I2_9ERIC|nr:Zinc finger CCCH domain-containing protein 18 [Camellia lanceoleosa]